MIPIHITYKTYIEYKYGMRSVYPLPITYPAGGGWGDSLIKLETMMSFIF